MLWVGVYLVTWEPECDHVHWDEIVIDTTKDIVPDEAAAEKIARYSLREGGPAGDFAMSDDEEFVVYDADVTFVEQTNKWIITFEPKEENTEIIIG